MKITRIAVRFVEVLAFLMALFYIALISITGNPYNLAIATVFMFIGATIELELFKRDKVKKQRDSVCIF